MSPLLAQTMKRLTVLALVNLAHGRSLRPRADGDGDSSGSSAPPDSIVIAHGICMALAFVVLFPLGASWMRFFNFKRLAWFHGGWQVLTYILVLAGMGIGIYLAVKVETWEEVNGHPIIGLVVVLALAVQAVLGLSHHLKYRKYGRPTALGISHRWWGRIILILGAINGGLGLQLAREESTAIIVYCVLAGVFFGIWAVSLVVNSRRTSKTPTPFDSTRVSSGPVGDSTRTSKESTARP